jgi:hypothetical protein
LLISSAKGRSKSSEATVNNERLDPSEEMIG